MPHPENASRVLSFQLHAGRSGQCALDGFSLVADSWKTTRSATRSPESLTRFVRETVARVRPSAIVLGVSRRDSDADADLRRVALRAIRPLRIPVVVRRVRDAFQLFRGRVRGRVRDELFHTLAEGFVHSRTPNFLPIRVRDHRSAWHALALAALELVERFPRSAAALASRRLLSIPSVKRALAEADVRQYPDPV